MKDPRVTLASVITLTCGELGMGEEEAIGLLFQLVAGLAAIMDESQVLRPNLEDLVTKARSQVDEHLELWAKASQIVETRDAT